jgi:hypothetical protein
MGMFATTDIPKGKIITEEQSLIRLLCFDVCATEDDPSYRDMVETLTYQFDHLASPVDRAFTENLEPFYGEESFVLRVMRKYGFEAYHSECFPCTALFRDICRANHSCDRANAYIVNLGNENDSSTGRLTASRAIEIGEEILIDYTVLGWALVEKGEMLKKYRFVCSRSSCKSCYEGFE